MLSLALPAAASLAVVLVCTGMVLALSRDSAPVARHRPAALAPAPITVPPLPDEPEPEPEAAAFDPLTSPLDDVEQFLAELGITNDMTTTHVYAEALAEDRDRVIAEDTRELETVQ